MINVLHRLRGTLAIAALCLAASSAHAQFTVPYVNNEGIPTAKGIAEDSLGSDVRLVSMLTVSGDVGGPTLAVYDYKTGKSDVWVYHYYSPSKRSMIAVAALNVPFLGWQGGGTVTSIDSMQISSRDTLLLDTTGSYFGSDKIFDRLKTDTAYIRHQQQYPGFDAQFANLGYLNLDDAPELPPIDLTQPFWTLVWGGAEDSSMICFVGSKSGDVFCQRVEVPSSVPYDRNAANKATLTVAPNPATGTTRVSVDIPAGAQMSGVNIALFNERGEQVLDLTESFTRNGYGFAEFDASALPAGVYYCRALGSNWTGLAGVVVGK